MGMTGETARKQAETAPALPDLRLVDRLARATPGCREAYAAAVSMRRGLSRALWTLRWARGVVAADGLVEV